MGEANRDDRRRRLDNRPAVASRYGVRLSKGLCAHGQDDRNHHLLPAPEMAENVTQVMKEEGRTHLVAEVLKVFRVE